MDTTAKPETTPEAPRFHLPEVENVSQAQRLAKELFGPLTRVVVIGPGDVVVGVERNGVATTLGTGPGLQEALEDAFLAVVELQKKGKTPADVMPRRPATNLVDKKRRDLVIKLPKTDTEVIDTLHFNEVLEVTDAIQIRDQKSVDYYVAKATVRLEKRKKEIAEAKAKLGIPAPGIVETPADITLPLVAE